MNEQRFEFPFVPQSVNKWSTRHWSKRSRAKRRLMMAMQSLMRVNGAKLIHGPVEVSIKFVFPTNRRRDADNYVKWPLDALIGVVIEDDNSTIVKQLHLEATCEKDIEKMIIIVKPYREAVRHATGRGSPKR